MGLGSPVLTAWVVIAAIGIVVHGLTQRDALRDWRNWHAYNGQQLLPLLQLHLITAALRGSVVTLNFALGLAYWLVPRPTRASLIIGILIVFALLYGETVLVTLAMFDRYVRRRIARRLGLPAPQ